MRFSRSEYEKMNRTLATDIVEFAQRLYVVDRAWVPDGDGWRSVRNHPIVLTDWQKRQLWDVFPPENGGRPVIRNYLDSENKKLGKSTKAGIVAAYLAATEPDGEVYVCAADKDQAKDRVFKSVKHAVEHGPLGDYATAYKDRIDWSNGAVIQAFPMDFKGAAGGSPVCAVFDELHTYSWEAERRLWDEFVIPPTLPYGIRWVASYAGFAGESVLLREVWDVVEAGELQPDWPEPIGLYHNDEAGWWGAILQGEEAYELVPWGRGKRGRRYLAEAKRSERPLSYLRLFCNQWVTNETAFCPPDWWKACRDPGLKPLAPTGEVQVFVGVDAAVKPNGDDAVAIGAYQDDDGRVCVAWYKVWAGQSRRRELRLDQTIEPYLEKQATRYRIASVHYDPRYFTNVAQRLRDRGLTMIEVTQSRPVLGPLGQNLYNLVQDGRLAYYPDERLENATVGARVKEIPQGLHIVKGTCKVDLLVALSMASWGALQQAGEAPRIPIVDESGRLAVRPFATASRQEGWKSIVEKHGRKPMLDLENRPRPWSLFRS
jgi:hypothetical protein